jgi:hypothetical protein
MYHRFGLTLVAALLLGLPATAVAKRFSVIYTGSGTYSSNYESDSSNNNGTCRMKRSEDTRFSWASSFSLNVGFDLDGSHAARDTDTPEHGLADNTSTEITFASGPGCRSNSGDSTLAGSSNCHGHDRPTLARVKATLTAGAVRGHARLKVEAFQQIEGTGFSGRWFYESDSCAASNDRHPLLIPSTFLVSRELTATFPIKYETLARLKRGHYFRVNVRAGHYAPRSLVNTTPCGDPCDAHLDWTGVVTVRRTR